MLSHFCVVIWSATVLWSDLSRRRIPNVLTIGMLLLAAVVWLWTGQAWLGGTDKDIALGVVLTLLLTFPAYITHSLGAADVKLLLAIAVLGGWQLVLKSFFVAGFLSLLTAAVLLFARYLMHRSASGGKWIPFGAALVVWPIFQIALGI